MSSMDMRLREFACIREMCSPQQLPQMAKYLKFKKKSDDDDAPPVVTDLVSIITSDDFWTELIGAYYKCEPLLWAVKEQRAAYNAADAVASFNYLYRLYDEDEKENRDEKFKGEVFKFADNVIAVDLCHYWDRTHCASHDACFMVDPRFSEEEITSTSYDVGTDYIKAQFIKHQLKEYERDVDVGAAENEYLEVRAEQRAAVVKARAEEDWREWGKRDFEEYRQGQSTPGNFWYNQLSPADTMIDSQVFLKTRIKCCKGKPHKKVVATVVLKIVCIMGHNAIVECSFNALKLLQSPQRGSLGPLMLDMCVFIANNIAKHPDVIDDFYGTPDVLRSDREKRRYIKKDSKYWESIKRKPFKQVAANVKSALRAAAAAAAAASVVHEQAEQESEGEEFSSDDYGDEGDGDDDWDGDDDEEEHSSEG